MVALATVAAADFQADFSGGANGFAPPQLLKPNELGLMLNTFARPGGGLEQRGGYRFMGDQATQGTGIFEMDQSTGTILTFQQIPNSWFDESMSVRARIMEQTPHTGDAIYAGAREKFGQLVFYLIAAYIPASATHGLVYEYWNGAAWTDFTAQVQSALADDKKLASAGPFPVEITLSWDRTALAGWSPNQVETRGYQYWIRIRVTVDLQNGGSPVEFAQRRVRSDWPGRRLLITSAINGTLRDWPGITLGAQNIGINGTVGIVRPPRTSAAALNDHLYIANDGTWPLLRWNGSRGVTRAPTVVSNNASPAGLAAPAAAPTEARVANANAYPAGFILRARISYEYGPEGILGESAPSPSRQIAAAIAVGGEQVTWTFVVPAATNVNAILLYVTYDLSPYTATNQRDRIGGFLLVRRVLRDSAEWNAGQVVDTFLERLQQSPISYSNQPPFYPKYICSGGGRIWMANDLFVACSDIGRGDSWNPTNIFPFQSIRGIVYHQGRLLVAQEEDWSYIDLPAVGLPDVQYFWRGIGLAQPDTIAIGDGEIHFVSKLGPARIVGDRIERTGVGRAWEDTNFWGKTAPQRRLASAAFYDGRFWFGVDKGGEGPQLTGFNAALDMRSNPDGGWCSLAYQDNPASAMAFGTLATVHCPLDHALARQKILLGFPDGSYAGKVGKLALLEYGTTDAWAAAATDGSTIVSSLRFRAMTMKNADRFKQYTHAHLLYRFPRTGDAGTILMVAQFLSPYGDPASKTYSVAGALATTRDQNALFYPTEQGGGRYRDQGAELTLVVNADTGFKLYSWDVRGSVEPWKDR